MRSRLDGGEIEGACLNAAMPFVAVTGGGGNVMPGQPDQLGMQCGRLPLTMNM